jgi:hypothetical protein
MTLSIADFPSMAAILHQGSCREPVFLRALFEDH